MSVRWCARCRAEDRGRGRRITWRTRHRPRSAHPREHPLRLGRRVRGEVRRPRLGGGAGAPRLGRAAGRHRGAIRDPPQGSVGGDAGPLPRHRSQTGAPMYPPEAVRARRCCGCCCWRWRRGAPAFIAACSPAGGRPSQLRSLRRRPSPPSSRSPGLRSRRRRRSARPPAPGLRIRRDDDRDEPARASAVSPAVETRASARGGCARPRPPRREPPGRPTPCRPTRSANWTRPIWRPSSTARCWSRTTRTRRWNGTRAPPAAMARRSNVWSPRGRPRSRSSRRRPR